MKNVLAEYHLDKMLTAFLASLNNERRKEKPIGSFLPRLQILSRSLEKARRSHKQFRPGNYDGTSIT